MKHKLNKHIRRTTNDQFMVFGEKKFPLMESHAVGLDYGFVLNERRASDKVSIRCFKHICVVHETSSSPAIEMALLLFSCKLCVYAQKAPIRMSNE